LRKRHISEQADPASADQSSQAISVPEGVVPEGVNATAKGLVLSTARLTLYFAMSFAVMASALLLAHV
jgi:hypothetical protein